MQDKVVYFAHGKESGPWGTKITQLAEIAKSKGFHVESPDYSGMTDPEARVEKLLELKPAAAHCLVLVGSSMGGYVSTMAAQDLKPAGLFLLAPAFFRAEYDMQNPTPVAGTTMIVHGWDDELISADDIIRYAKEHKVRLDLVLSDHRLISAMPTIEKLFADFLDEVSKTQS